MPATITAKEQNLVKVFNSNDYLFEIPSYQRPFAWTEIEVRELLDDLIDAWKRGGDEPYFLGSIVLIKEADSNDQEVYSAKWEDIEENLGRADFRDLFTHIQMIDRKDKRKDVPPFALTPKW